VWAYVCGAWFINVRYLFTKRKKRAIYDSFLAYKSIQHFNRLKDQRSIQIKQIFKVLISFYVTRALKSVSIVSIMFQESKKCKEQS